MYTLIRDVVPNDSDDQVSDEFYIELLAKQYSSPAVLDLGCGHGNSVDVFMKHFDNGVSWTGVDIESSPEVDTRKRIDLSFDTYDGQNLPYSDETFDIIYSHQVFEHVRFPEKVLSEIARCLKPEGSFIGSVSCLEPYHSFQYWNYTAWGWRSLMDENRLITKELRPGIDGISLINRSYSNRPIESTGWFQSSPINQEISEWRVRSNRSYRQSNVRKLKYCGQIVFWATKA